MEYTVGVLTFDSGVGLDLLLRTMMIHYMRSRNFIRALSLTSSRRTLPHHFETKLEQNLVDRASWNDKSLQQHTVSKTQ